MNKNKIRILLAIGIFLFSILGYSQQIIKESIDSGGGKATATGITIFHTIGEVVVAEDNGSIHVSEGFIGPEFATYLDIDNYTELMGIKAFPNPTTEFLNFNFSEAHTYQIQVFDMQGKEVLTKETDNVNSYSLDVTGLQTASYIVLIKNTYSKQFKTFRLLKK